MCVGLFWGRIFILASGPGALKSTLENIYAGHVLDKWEFKK